MSATTVESRLRSLERALGDADEVRCPVCANIEAITYVSSAEAKPRPFCSACGRNFRELVVLDPYQE